MSGNDDLNARPRRYEEERRRFQREQARGRLRELAAQAQAQRHADGLAETAGDLRERASRLEEAADLSLLRGYEDQSRRATQQAEASVASTGVAASAGVAVGLLQEPAASSWPGALGVMDAGQHEVVGAGQNDDPARGQGQHEGGEEGVRGESTERQDWFSPDREQLDRQQQQRRSVDRDGRVGAAEEDDREQVRESGRRRRVHEGGDGGSSEAQRDPSWYIWPRILMQQQQQQQEEEVPPRPSGPAYFPPPPPVLAPAAPAPAAPAPSLMPGGALPQAEAAMWDQVVHLSPDLDDANQLAG